MATEVLKTVGSIAGLGGLALGVFLLLFRRISLPQATRRHLTLFMWLVWGIALVGVVCYALPEIIRAFQAAPDKPSTGVSPPIANLIDHEARLRAQVAGALAGTVAESEQIQDVVGGVAFFIQLEGKASIKSVKRAVLGVGFDVFILDCDNRMIMHPTKPMLNGKRVGTQVDAAGNQVFRQMVTKALDDGSGWVPLKWIPRGRTEPVTKATYVQLAKHGSERFIVCGGFYPHDIDIEN